MWVVSKARLRLFWQSPGHEDSESPLLAWYAHVSHKSVSWRSWGDVKADIGSASIVGNCAVFNIGGNKYRLVARILYRSQKVYILKVMTHKDYDEGRWKEQCGCFSPPPDTRQVASTAPKPKPK